MALTQYFVVILLISVPVGAQISGSFELGRTLNAMHLKHQSIEQNAINLGNLWQSFLSLARTFGVFQKSTLPIDSQLATSVPKDLKQPSESLDSAHQKAMRQLSELKELAAERPLTQSERDGLERLKLREFLAPGCGVDDKTAELPEQQQIENFPVIWTAPAGEQESPNSQITLTGGIYIADVLDVVLKFLPFKLGPFMSVIHVSRAWRRQAEQVPHWFGTLICKAQCCQIIVPRQITSEGNILGLEIILTWSLEKRIRLIFPSGFDWFSIIRAKCLSVDDNFISLIAQHCQHLQYLSVCGSVVTDASISLIAQNCPRLQHLDVSYTCGQVTDASISLIAQHCPGLQRLNVSCTRGQVTDASISLIAQLCPDLQHLDVSYTCGQVTDASISLIAKHCPDLQHLDVSDTYGKVTDASISLIAKHCPGLQHLDVSYTRGKVTDASISLIKQLCPKARCSRSTWN